MSIMNIVLKNILKNVHYSKSNKKSSPQQGVFGSLAYVYQ
jgi:hypothetical protein